MPELSKLKVSIFLVKILKLLKYVLSEFKVHKYCSLTRKNILLILIHLIEISVNDRTFTIQSCFDVGKVERIAVNVMHRLYVHLCIVGKFVCQV